MKICDWCVRQIPWWRLQYCKNCSEALRLDKPSGPSRPDYASQVLLESRERRHPKVVWE